MATTLTKKELASLIQALRGAFQAISALRGTDRLASLLQYPKIPPALSESLALHLLQDNIILPGLSSLHAGARSESDLVATDSRGRRLAIEVKGTGASAWVFLGPKDYKADYLVWILFGGFFASADEHTVRVCVADPNLIQPRRNRITMSTLTQLGGGRLSWTDIDLLKYIEEPRRAGIDRKSGGKPSSGHPGPHPKQDGGPQLSSRMSRAKRGTHMYSPRINSGAYLNELWGVGASDAKFHREGKFFMPATSFPAALFDPNGYLFFRTEADYFNSPYLSVRDRVNVPGGIAGVPGYKRMDPDAT